MFVFLCFRICIGRIDFDVTTVTSAVLFLSLSLSFLSRATFSATSSYLPPPPLPLSASVWYFDFERVQRNGGGTKSVPHFIMQALASSTAAPAPSGNGTQNGAADFITQLLPAIGQVFFVILLGFGLGTVKLIPVEHAEPLGKLCGVVLLPVAVFTAMLTLQGGDASWQFLGGIVVAKGSIFALVLTLALAVNRGPSRLGTAAIRAVFCTQSNDFAFGLPIFTALFANHPEYDGFLYIVAPISLVILNPIAFALMEYSRQSQLKAKEDDEDSIEDGSEEDDDAGAGKTKKRTSSASSSILAKVLLKVARDPLVIMTFLGVILRLVFWAVDYTLDDQVRFAACAFCSLPPVTERCCTPNQSVSHGHSCSSCSFCVHDITTFADVRPPFFLFCGRWRKHCDWSEALLRLWHCSASDSCAWESFVCSRHGVCP